MFQGIHDYFFGSEDKNTNANLVGGSNKNNKAFTLAEKNAISKKLKNISEEEAIKDYEH